MSQSLTVYPTRRVSKHHPAGRKPHPTDWTTTELEALARLWPAAPWEEIQAALAPYRTRVAIARRANHLGIERVVRQLGWSPQERAVLRARYPAEGPGAVAAALPGRTVQQVKAQACFLKVRYRPEKKAPAPKPQLRPAARTQPGTPKRKAAPQAETPKPAPVKRSPATPLLNARVEERRRNQAQVEKESIIKALQRLDPNSPGRYLYARVASQQGGAAANEALRAWFKQQPKQAA